jgi:hypothetical protein
VKRWLGLGIVACLASLAIWSILPMSTPDRPIITVKTRVLGSFLAFFRDNGLAEYEARYRQLAKDPADSEGDPIYLVARASADFATDPGGVIVQYDHPACPLSLPAGRQVLFSPEAGFVTEIEAIFPLEPLAWNDMQAAVTAQVAALDTAGWRRSTGYFTSQKQVKPILDPLDFQDKTGPKWADVGYWEQCDSPWIKAYLQVRHYNSSSPGSFTPPAALSEPLNPLAEDRFLLLLRVSVEPESPLAKDLDELAQRRRLAINGDPMARIGAEVWLDDPDWRPAGWAGQVIR